MQKLPWYNAAPSQYLIAKFHSMGNIIATATSKDRLMAYVPYSTSWVKLKKFVGADTAHYAWINPSTGVTWMSGAVPGSLKFLPPDTSEWLRAIDNHFMQTQDDIWAPLTSVLDQNYPNPFNPSTTIKYELSETSHVNLSVFDVLGRRVSVLVNETRRPGIYETEFDGSHFASGVYFYRLQAGEFTQSKRLLILK